MRKFRPLTIEEPKPSRLGARLRLALLSLVLLAVSPILWDGTKLLVARWQSLSGAMVSVETPALDYTNEFLRSSRRSGNQMVGSFYRRIPWQRDVVVGTLVVCAGACCLLLNRR